MINFKKPKENSHSYDTETGVNRKNARDFINNFLNSVDEINQVYNSIQPYEGQGLHKVWPADTILTTTPINICGDLITLQMRFSIDSHLPAEIVIIPE